MPSLSELLEAPVRRSTGWLNFAESNRKIASMALPYGSHAVVAVQKWQDGDNYFCVMDRRSGEYKEYKAGKK